MWLSIFRARQSSEMLVYAIDAGESTI